VREGRAKGLPFVGRGGASEGAPRRREGWAAVERVFKKIGVRKKWSAEPKEERPFD